MTLEEFLVWEEQQEERWEFDGLRPIAMTGGTRAHAFVQASLVRLVGNASVGTPCRVYASHLKVATATTARYPDAFVACSKSGLTDLVESEPVVIFEILSPSAKAEDLVRKSAEYRRTPSVQRYVVLEQAEISITVFTRRGDLWVTDALSGTEAVLDMPEISVTLTLGEIYADVSVAEEPSGP